MLTSLCMSAQRSVDPVIVIHGGAGAILKSNMTLELEKAYEDKLTEAMDSGYVILERGGSAEDAVCASIRVMEASPLFNAGIGSVFTHDETNEMDASIMRGIDRQAGAVSGVSRIKSPILAARTVMDSSEHVMLSGKGAEEFAEEKGLEMVDPAYFRDERRLKQLRRVKDQEGAVLDHDGDRGEFKVDTSEIEFNVNLDPDKKFGTVGCVALDNQGNLAAGTSTGGMTNKRYGRVGDSPIIGAGTFADNASCAISCTGHGEFFIRYAVAFNVASRMTLKGETLEEASNYVIMQELEEVGGKGGLIGLDTQGNIVMPFNTAGMYRAWRKGEETEVGMYKE